MKFLTLSLSLFLTLFLAGCGQKEVSSLDQAKAAQCASEAGLHLQLREYKEAIGLLEQAVKLNSEVPEYWSSLGVANIRAGNKKAARTAYEEVLRIQKAQAKKKPDEAGLHLQQIGPLLLLGRVQDARDLLAECAKKFPKNRDVTSFVDGKVIDQMLADESLKALSVDR